MTFLEAVKASSLDPQKVSALLADLSKDAPLLIGQLDELIANGLSVTLIVSALEEDGPAAIQILRDVGLMTAKRQATAGRIFPGNGAFLALLMQLLAKLLGGLIAPIP